MTRAQNLINKSINATLIAISVFITLEASGITSFIGTAEAASAPSAQCEQVSVEKTASSSAASTPVITMVDVRSSQGVIADILKQSDF